MEVPVKAVAESSQRLIVPCCCAPQQHQPQSTGPLPAAGLTDWDALLDQVQSAFSRGNTERHAGSLRRICRRYGSGGIPYAEWGPVARLAEVYLQLAMKGDAQIASALASLCKKAAKGPQSRATTDATLHASDAAKLVEVFSRVLVGMRTTEPASVKETSASETPAAASNSTVAGLGNSAGVEESEQSCGSPCVLKTPQKRPLEGENWGSCGSLVVQCPASATETPGAASIAPMLRRAAKGNSKNTSTFAALRHAVIELMEATAIELSKLVFRHQPLRDAGVAVATSSKQHEHLCSSGEVTLKMALDNVIRALKEHNETQWGNLEVEEEFALLRVLQKYAREPQVAAHLCCCRTLNGLLSKCVASLREMANADCEAQEGSSNTQEQAEPSGEPEADAAVVELRQAGPAAAQGTTAAPPPRSSSATHWTRQELLLQLLLQILQAYPASLHEDPWEARELLAKLSFWLHQVLSPKASFRKKQVRNDLICVLLLIARQPRLLPLLTPSGALCQMLRFLTCGSALNKNDTGSASSTTALAAKSQALDTGCSGNSSSITSRQKDLASPEDVELLQLLWLCVCQCMVHPSCCARALHFSTIEALLAFADYGDPRRQDLLAFAPWRFSECQLRTLGAAAVNCLGTLAVVCPASVVAAGGPTGLLRIAVSAAAAGDADKCGSALRQSVALLRPRGVAAPGEAGANVEAPTKQHPVVLGGRQVCAVARRAFLEAKALEQLLQLLEALMKQQQELGAMAFEEFGRPGVSLEDCSNFGDPCSLTSSDGIPSEPPTAIPLFVSTAADGLRALALSSKKTIEAFVAAGGTEALVSALERVPRKHIQPLLAALTDALGVPIVADALRSWKGVLQVDGKQQTLHQLLLQMWLGEQQRFQCLSPGGEIADPARPMRLRCFEEPHPWQEAVDIKKLCSTAGNGCCGKTETNGDALVAPWARQLPNALSDLMKAAAEPHDDLRFELYTALQQLSAGCDASPTELTVAEAQQQLLLNAGEVLWRLEALTETKTALADAEWLRVSWEKAFGRSIEVRDRQRQLAFEHQAKEAAEVDETMQQLSDERQHARNRRRKALGLSIPWAARRGTKSDTGGTRNGDGRRRSNLQCGQHEASLERDAQGA
ncbi:hypothetical protein cyc_01555 [Cyclospora cayetanensis]|uniref:Uncharacterized protein n=1 Tax=Cyclospora cayetanensis TaxID=88456 RepID=A0A1D3CWX5_9EIME|nr:hypothetical protein cyc_01555 [Cyclospora cayetanensis]